VKRLDRVIDGFLKFIRPEEIDLESVHLAKGRAGLLDLMTARASRVESACRRPWPADLPASTGAPISCGRF